MPKLSPAATKAEHAAHVARLTELRDIAAARLATTSDEYDAIRSDPGDVGAGDDEGGGEADVTSTERDRLRAAILVETQALEAIEAAMVRSSSPDWANCANCHGPIGSARLEALPSTDLCVSCKAASNNW